MMQKSHSYLKNIHGLQFYKLMGSGKGDGFNPFPDWSTYALLTVWDKKENIKEFFNDHQLPRMYKANASAMVHIHMRCIKSHGFWSGIEPFVDHQNIEVESSSVAIITRATIRWQKLRKFWKYVPKASAPISGAKGLLYTKGIGEVPIVQMATLSIWKSIGDMKKYAYESKEHREAIVFTRKYNWYKEELFARFVVDEIEGNLDYF
jgi:heme-degrading monooxygenase HmoA